jgi:hypothetical protein
MTSAGTLLPARLGSDLAPWLRPCPNLQHEVAEFIWFLRSNLTDLYYHDVSRAAASSQQFRSARLGLWSSHHERSVVRRWDYTIGRTAPFARQVPIYGMAATRAGARSFEPGVAAVNRERKCKHVTLQVLWKNVSMISGGYRHSRSCELYRA